jgi:hypothetical protein
MSATYVVGDTREVVAAIPDGSVDLVLTSPPFLALRSYLPSDHPDKGREIGSESGPAEFVGTLLELTAEWRRVLAPHGTLAVELGDTYSGSGGAGGDYTDAGWRNGQAKFGGSAGRASRESCWSVAQATWLAGVIDTEGYIGVRRQESQRTSPNFSAQVRVTMMERQVVDRCAEITGVGAVTQDGRSAYSWSVSGQRARYVLTNIWPYLLIKQRQAKAAVELQRDVEDKRRRGKYERLTTDDIAFRQMIREYVMGLNARGEERGRYVPTWEPPTPPRVNHPAVAAMDGWPLAKSLAMIPELYRLGLAYGVNPLTGAESPAGRWRVRNTITWCRSNPPVGALGDKFRPSTSDLVVACVSDKRWFDLDAVRTASDYDRPNLRGKGSRSGGDVPGQRPNASDHTTNPAGAPPLDHWILSPGGYTGAHFAVFPAELCRIPVESMCPRRVCRTCGTPSRREVSVSYAVAPDRGLRTDAARRYGSIDGKRHNDHRSTEHTTTGWSSCDCPGTDGIRDDGYHTGTGWRPGRVLDPFAGSGTSLLVATGRGRDAIGVDIDERNLDLARDRVGMLLNEAKPGDLTDLLTLEAP